MLRKNIVSIAYYVPFCPRPSLVVTRDVLDRLRKVEVDESLAVVKQKLATELAAHFAMPLPLPSPHLYVGAGVRSVLVSVPLSAMLCTAEPFFGIVYFVVHNWVYWFVVWFSVVDKVALCARFKALCGE